MGDNRNEYLPFVFATSEEKVAKQEGKGFIRMALFSIALVSLVVFF
jgi:hypothetical protein